MKISHIAYKDQIRYINRFNSNPPAMLCDFVTTNIVQTPPSLLMLCGEMYALTCIYSTDANVNIHQYRPNWFKKHILRHSSVINTNSINSRQCAAATSVLLNDKLSKLKKLNEEYKEFIHLDASVLTPLEMHTGFLKLLDEAKTEFDDIVRMLKKIDDTAVMVEVPMTQWPDIFMNLFRRKKCA